MKSTEFYNKPSGTITMVMHKGGTYNIETGKIENGIELARKEVKNLIVNSASTFMATRMAPGATNGVLNEQKGYEPGRVGDDDEYETVGLKYLAVGVGILIDESKEYIEGQNDVDTNRWPLQNPPSEKLIDNKLKGEIERKKFTDWKFVTSNGDISNEATNILLLSTTFLESEAIGPLTEMGLFGGASASNSKDTGVMFNYKTFKVWNKPSDARLTISWRLTF